MTERYEEVSGTDRPPATEFDTKHEDQLVFYGVDRISVRHGPLNAWLLVVYAVLFAWALYYGATHWGGLGPGLDLSL
jgi:hypothetical protein